MSYEGERATLVESFERKGPAAIETYQAEKNRTSLDGLPALPTPPGRPDAEPPAAVAE